MLDQARMRAPGNARIDWRQADALKLPFEDQAFDVVACQFGVMFFPDKRAGYAEARRVLKQGGRFFFSVWDRIAENEFADAVTEALAGVFPDDPPRFLARTPHGHHDIERIRADLAAVGFAEASVEAVDRISKAPSARDPAIAYCQGTPLRNEIEARDASRLQQATDHAASALAERFGSGPVEGRIRAFVISAAPDAREDVLDAWVQTHCQMPSPGRPQVCGEQITIEARGAAGGGGGAGGGRATGRAPLRAAPTTSSTARCSTTTA